MNKEVLKLLKSLKLDAEIKKKILENAPKTRGELIRLATQLGIELDIDAGPVALDESEIAKISAGSGDNLYAKNGF